MTSRLSSRQSAGALLTDLYQLTMLKSYYELGMEDTSVFEFFVRRLPEHRNFMVFAGLQQVVDYLENLHFSRDELAWLENSGHFDAEFIGRLGKFRFTGDVHAMPEGSVFFPDEPVVRITAPLPEAQLVESRLINLLHYQTLIASKAVRCRLAAPGKTLIDFGMRRAHGAEAALFAARASYIAGFHGTATVQAGQEFDIPVYGTMAHSYIQAHDTESQAFENFARSHPDNIVLLIDTYDTNAGAEQVVRLAGMLRAEGIAIKAVRLDSGDLVHLSTSVRHILDAGDCGDIALFASGNLDEYRLADLLLDDCPVDGFGIGTSMTISEDSPSLDCVYKLQEYAGQARRKRSVGKTTWPGRKQVCRQRSAGGLFELDRLILGDEGCVDGEALLLPVMRSGERLEPPESLAKICERTASQLDSLPDHLTSLADSKTEYPVLVSTEIRDLTRQVDRRFA